MTLSHPWLTRSRALKPTSTTQVKTVAELKALPKQIDESRRVVRERLDALKDEVRRPLTEWEAEQERIKAEEAMNALHAEALAMNEEFDRQLAARIESDHEMALLMNDAFDREQAEKKQKPSASALPAKKRSSAVQKRKRNVRQQNRHSVKLTLQPPESAKRFWPKSEPSANSEKQLNVLSVKSRPPWKQNAARHRKKPIASAARQSNANWPASAEEKRKAEEESRRAADVEHRRGINSAAVQALINQGIPHEWAKACIIAVALGKVPATTIKY